MHKYQLQGIMQNTSYREQYKTLVTGNSAKIPVTRNNTKYQLHGKIQSYSLLYDTVQAMQAVENNIK